MVGLLATRCLRTLTLLWVALSFALAGPGFAQHNIAFSHQAWSSEEGLPDAGVRAVLQARDGYLWIATEGGAARFDGTEFTVFRHETEPAFRSNDISALAQDSTGNLWFGTADGLISLHGGAFHHYGEGDGLPSARILSLAATQDGRLLILTGSGLALWNGEHFTTLAGVTGRVTALDAATDGALRILTEDAGTWLLTPGGLRREPSLLGLPERVLGVGPGPGGITWSYSAREVAVSGAGPLHTWRTGAALPGSRITVLHVDREGTGWVGTTHGLFLLDPASSAPPQPINPLQRDSILSLTEDREGNTWVGTEFSGLHVLRPRKFRSEPASAGEIVTAVVAPSEDLAWFGTRNGGVHRIRHGTGDQPVAADALTSPIVLSLAAGPHGDLWIGTPDGLNHVVDAKVTKFTSADGLPDDFVRSVLVDSHGVVWAGTRGGLARIEAGRITVRTQADGMGSDSIGPLLVTNGGTPGATRGDDLWVGTSGGLSHLHDGRLDTFIPYQGATSGTKNKQTSIVTALAQTGSQELLVAVHGAGLLFFHEGHFRAVALAPLPSEISSLAIDRKGFAWIRGLHGLFRISVAALRRCANQGPPCPATLDRFGTADGLPNDNATAEGWPQLAQTPDGTLLIATRKGLAIADPVHLPVNNVPPLVVIQRFTVDGIDLPLRSKYREDAEDPEGIIVPSGRNRYNFSFAALSYTLPAKVRYRYKLDGFDRDWVDAGSGRTASYTSLPPRSYRFEVQAQNNDGIQNETNAAVSFRILPPFYRRWWFAALALLCAAALVLLIIRLRERVVQRRFALVLGERNRMAREIHDTLAQDFVSVSLGIDIASSLLRNQQGEQALDQLASTRQLVKDGLQAARQSIWNLRASGDEDSLPARLSALVTRFAVDGKPPRLSIGGAFRKLSASIEAEVLRIAGESLSNVQRHARAGEVSVALSYGTDSLHLTVRDDGEGFSPPDAQRLEGHYGLRGMHERAAALGGELMITSKPGEGTTVSLVVPLRKESHTL